MHAESSPQVLPVARAAAWPRWLPIAALVAGYALLGVWLLGPAALAPRTTMPGWDGDNFYFLWQFIWIREALLAGQSPLAVPQIFYPEGFALARDDMTLLNSIPAAIIGAVLGDVFAYNLMLVTSSTLSGLCMFLWVRRLTGSAAAAAVMGLAFVLLPFRAIRMAGHFDLVTTWPIPLTLLLADRAVERDRTRDWALVAVGFTLAALGAWYFAPALVLTLPFYVLVRGWAGWRSRARWRGIAVYAVTAIVLLGPPALPYFMVAGPGTLRHQITEALKGSASPTDYVVPSVLHPVFGDLARAYFANSEFGSIDRALSAGIVPLLLAIVAVVTVRTRAVAAIAVFGLAAFVLSLGPVLQWAGTSVSIPWGTRIGGFVAGQEGAMAEYLGVALREKLRAGEGFIPLPAFFANVWLPLGTAIRSWCRLGIFADAAILALAGIALARWRRFAPLVAVLVAFELLTVGMPNSLVTARPVDVWLRNNDDGTPIMIFPIPKAVEPREVYATLDHRRTIVNGHATFPSLTFRLARGTLNTFPAPESLAILRGWGVRQIAIYPQDYGNEWPAVRQQLESTPALRRLATVEGAEVWGLADG